jgi:hypothetical protein
MAARNHANDRAARDPTSAEIGRNGFPRKALVVDVERRKP